MGEWKVQVPVKLDRKTVDRLDEYVQQFSPFCEGRSAIARVLIEYALSSIDSGTLSFDLVSIQRVLRLSNPCTPKIVKGARG